MPESQLPAFARPVSDVLKQLEVDPAQGLSSSEAKRRRSEHGLNELREAQQRSAWSILVDQFKSIVIVLLLAAAVAAFVTARWPEGIALVLVTLINTLIGFFSEWKAVRSMEALRALGAQHTHVVHDGEVREVEVKQLVPGDIVELRAEQLVPADLRIVQADQLRVNEAALTGESVPVSKTTEAADAETPLAERPGMLYKGTTVVEGSARAVVVATGMQTELGRISELAAGAEAQATPLQEKLDRLGQRLAWITIAVAIVVAAAGLLAGRDTVLMIETAIALGAAAIPEGLPIVATISLARGMYLMAQRNAVVNRLTAVETLGATRVIFTDKTGTLTENRMTVRRVIDAQGEHAFSEQDPPAGNRDVPDQDATNQGTDNRMAHIVWVGVLCNNAILGADRQPESDKRPSDESSRASDNGDGKRHDRLSRRPNKAGGNKAGGNKAGADKAGANKAEASHAEPERTQGDPTEVALLTAGMALGMDRQQLLNEYPEEREVSFDPDVMMMATYHRTPEGMLVAVKGAPQAVLDACTQLADGDKERALSDDDRRDWIERADRLAGEGLRLLAMAEKRVDSVDAEPYERLTLLGLVGLADPPRHDVRGAVEECQQAGMRAVMVTGDRPDTGWAIGQQVGMAGDGVAIHGRDLTDLENLSREDRQRVLHADVFARVTPEQKLNLVRMYQDEGEIVAMTGDGVNDAPALKQADIGVAMGKRGTDAAKQVADMVLRDDEFATIVAAVRQGRIIFANIRKSVVFMLCTNLAEILVVTIASLVQAPMPLRPLQILYLNVLTDVFPALALGLGKGGDHVMQLPPRDPREAVLTRHHWMAIGGWSVVIGACVLAAFAIALQWLGLSETQAVTVSFLTLGFSKLWFVVNLRDRGSRAWNNDIVRNPWIWGALGLCTTLLVVAVYWRFLGEVLPTEAPGREGWLLILGTSVIPALLGLIVPGIRFYTAKPEMARAENDKNLSQRDAMPQEERSEHVEQA